MKVNYNNLSMYIVNLIATSKRLKQRGRANNPIEDANFTIKLYSVQKKGMQVGVIEFKN